MFVLMPLQKTIWQNMAKHQILEDIQKKLPLLFDRNGENSIKKLVSSPMNFWNIPLKWQHAFSGFMSFELRKISFNWEESQRS